MARDLGFNALRQFIWNDRVKSEDGAAAVSLHT